MCALKNTKCPHDSLLECEIVRVHTFQGITTNNETFKSLSDGAITQKKERRLEKLLKDALKQLGKRWFLSIIFGFDLVVLVALSEILRSVYSNWFWLFVWIFVLIPLILVTLWYSNPFAIKKLLVTFGLSEESPIVEKTRTEECEKELEKRKDDLRTWTDSLEELSEIEDAFGKGNLDGKTILDIGTDCVKPLYIALKFKPHKIIGIDEELSYSYASDLEQKSKLFSNTEIRFYDCSIFDNETLNRILRKEKMEKSDFVLVSKTLHHLRTAECVAKERDEEHECLEDEGCCIYGFEEQVIFEKLLGLGKRVIIYEFFDPSDTDDDKIRGRGGYFTTKEWKRIFKYLSGRYKVEFIRPKQFNLNKETLNNVDSTLRQVDYLCFYVEERSHNE
jgi:hypothetical protein